MYNPLPLKRKVFYGWWVLLAVALATFFASGEGSFTFTVIIIPMTQDFGSSHTELLGVLTVAGFLGAFMSPLAGRLVDRYGARVVLVSSLLFSGVALILILPVRSLWQFYVLYAAGLGVSMAAVVRVGAPAVAANWFIRRRGIVFAIIMATPGVAGIAFALVAQAIVDWLDWRMVWFIIGVATVVLAVPVTWLIVKGSPEDMGLRPDGDIANPPAPLEESPQRPGTRPQRNTDIGWTLNEAMKTPTFWLLNFSLVLEGFPSASILPVMHPYFTDLGLSTATAARLVSFYAFSHLVGALVWGTLAQRFAVRGLLAPFAVFYGAAILLLVVVGGSSVALVYLSLLLLGIGVMGGFQLGTQVWADYYGRREIGSIIGAFNLIRTLAVALGPLLAAGIHDSMGSYRPSFVLFAGFCFAAALGLAFSRPPQKTITAQVGGL